MSRLALLPVALLLSLGAASAAPSHFGPPSIGAGLSVRAGLGGVARPGRWLPVEVRVGNDASRVQGVLRVEWGDAVVLRDIDVAAGAAQHITVMLRAIAAAPMVHVSIDGDAASGSADAPVELAPLETPLTLCVGEAAATDCSVRIAEDTAPSTWRGFDMADVVIWPAAAASARHDAVQAFATWRAMRWLGDEGPADPVLPPFDRDTPAVRRLSIALGLFGCAVALLTALAAWRRAQLSLTLGLPVLLGPAAWVWMLNPVGPGTVTTTSAQMTSVVHQFAETAQSTFAAKIEVEHASTAMLSLQPQAADATLTTSGAGTVRSVSVENRDGQALYRDTAGVGARRRAALDGTLDTVWLEITATGTQWSATNRAPFALRDCHWRGTSLGAIGTIPPGAHVALHAASSPVAGDSVVCTLPSDWLSWAQASSPVDMRGQSFLVYHFWPAPQERDSHAAR